MSDKDKDKNVVEQLLDSVITSSDSNIGPIEQRLNEIAKSPNWELQGNILSVDNLGDIRQQFSYRKCRRNIEFRGAFAIHHSDGHARG